MTFVPEATTLVASSFKDRIIMTTRTVTGLYDTYDAAAQAVSDLEAAHIPDTTSA